ncbi:MAG: ABC transporter ATP-binding protein, partial [Candidatus Baltobacteraceae bacterium]
MTALRLEALAKRFGSSRAPVRALDSITLAVAAGEFLTVVGPSGSGKTTLLRVVAGLETPDAGRVWFGDRDVTALPTRRRRVGVVFAHGALYPHRTVAGNVAYGPRLDGLRGAALATRTREVAAALHVDELLDRLPGGLSSGQAQR